MNLLTPACSQATHLVQVKRVHVHVWTMRHPDGRIGAGGSPAQNVPSRAPSMPDVMPQLAAMSTGELTQMLEDEQKFVDFIRREAAKAHIVKVGLGTNPLRLPKS